MASQLTAKEKAEYQEMFALFDTNGDGQISIDELQEAMQSLGYSKSREEMETMMKRVDTNGDMCIGFDEFVDLIERRMLEENLRRAFRVFDKENNGYITEAEVRSALARMGEKISEEEIQEMLREADADGDGTIEYAEFVKMVMDKS